MNGRDRRKEEGSDERLIDTSNVKMDGWNE